MTSSRGGDRPYDLVLYGASGFTGREATKYLAVHAPEAMRWAIAGRDRGRLERVRSEVGSRAAAADVLLADSGDAAAVDAMTSSTRVLLSTVGPFVRHGDPVVDGCVRHGTHYADITGETTWVRRLIDRHHERAAADGTRIVPFCGFDSVPSDVGTYLAVRQLQSAQGIPCREAKSFFRLRGGLNGGTLATVLHTAGAGELRAGYDPFLLDPPRERSRAESAANRDPRRVMADADAGGWIGPFVMGPVNTRVVRRSAALLAAWGEGYGDDFRYQEYHRHSSRAAAHLTTAALGAVAVAIAWAPSRRLLGRVLPPPGSGPSEETMTNGFFRSDHVATGAGGARARVTMRHQGDPGNRATVRFLCESGLSLAGDPSTLPGGRGRGGVLTPVTALGDVLIGRLGCLADSGLTIEVGAS